MEDIKFDCHIRHIGSCHFTSYSLTVYFHTVSYHNTFSYHFISYSSIFISHPTILSHPWFASLFPSADQSEDTATGLRVPWPSTSGPLLSIEGDG